MLNALPLLDSDAFFVANTDVVLWEPRQPALDVLCRAWEPETMDALLLLVPMQNAGGFEGAGDFFLGRDGKIERPSPGEAAPFVYASIQIVASHLFDDPPEVSVLIQPALGPGCCQGTPCRSRARWWLVHDRQARKDPGSRGLVVNPKLNCDSNLVMPHAGRPFARI